jgi:hypothetical protein
MVLLFLQWCLAGWMALAHPYYISVTEIEYAGRDRELGVSCKFFSDDIEGALKAYSNNKVDILKGDKATNGKLLDAYIRKHLGIKVDGKALDPQFLGYENDQEATWCYFSVKEMPAPRNVEIFINLLYEYRSEQVNMVHVIVDGNRKSSKLSPPDNHLTVSFP